MSKRRPDQTKNGPAPFRYRPTPPPPVAESPSRRKLERTSQQSRQPAGSLSNNAFVVWLLLLIMPVLALRELCEFMDWRMVSGAVVLISFVTWSLYRSDKAKAQTGAWRTPESTLHLAELVGGWPAAFLAQRRFRHKIAKGSYQFVYWGIVVVHQYAALDCLLGWRISHGVSQWCRGLL